MARFTIYSPNGVAIYEGTPAFTGQYMKPGLLEFREVALPALVDLVPGCYVDYTRTGYRYRIYTVPQLKKQARSNTYGGAFVYQSVQLYDASKMLEYCPFRDLVTGDNRIHFSTQPSISTFEGCDGLARRFEACLVDQYGAGSWQVRIATAEENPALHDLMLEPRDFTVSGVNLLECLDKIYEIWPEVGWVYKVEEVDGVMTDSIVIGGGGANPNVGTYAYGKGNGLTSLTRTAANAEEIANRIFAYGSSRNMVLPSWYRNQDIKDAESVDIQNLMLPIGPVGTPDTPDYWPGWGETDGERDAAKAFVENAASILKNGLRPSTVYFNGNGEYPEIYPTIRETTIGMVRTAIGDSTAKYYPSTTIYTDLDARIDKLLSVQPSFDSGKQSTDGKSAVASDYSDIAETGSGTVPAYSQENETIFEETMTITEAGSMVISASANLTGTVTAQVYTVILSVILSVNGEAVGARSEELVNNNGQWALHTVNVGTEKIALAVGDEVTCLAYIQVVNFGSATPASYSYTANGGYSAKVSLYREKTFNITLRQVGFDIGAQADLADGKTIAMRTGDCAGRSFSIKSVQYDSANDAWALECWRTEDESLSQWFPNSQFGVAAGDEFVLLDIAMPDIYIAMASQKLLVAARELLADSAVERWQYIPEIDAKYMVENSRTIRCGEYMAIIDPNIIIDGIDNFVYFRTSEGGYFLTINGERIIVDGGILTTVLVDTVVINEGEAAIPTYKVTLRDRKKKTWTESAMPEASSSKSVGNTTVQPTSTGGGDSFFQLDESGNVTLKSQYQNLWVPGWLAAKGVGNGSSGGVSNLRQLNDVYHSAAAVLRADGTTPAQPGDSLVYDSSHGWLASPVSGASGVVKKIDVGGTQVSPDSNGLASITNALNSHINWWAKEFITVTREYTQDVGTHLATISIGRTNPISVEIWAPNGGGGGGSYSAGTGININNDVISLETASTSQLGGVKVDGTTVTINNGVISAVGGGGGGGGLTSIGLSMPSQFTVSPSTLTANGTFAVSLKSSYTIPSAQDWTNVYSAAHTHGNLTVLGSITATKVNNWDEAYGWGDHAEAGYVTLHTAQHNIDGAKTFTTKTNFSGGLAVAQTAYIDLGPVRIMYQNNALRITKVNSSDTNKYGLWADGFLAAYGVGSGEAVRYVNCTQNAYDNLSAKDPSTIYTIGTAPSFSRIYIGSIKIYGN